MTNSGGVLGADAVDAIGVLRARSLATQGGVRSTSAARIAGARDAAGYAGIFSSE